MTKRQKKPLTHQVLESVKPGETSVELADPSSPGLRFIVEPSGLKYWQYRYRVGDRLRRMTLGHYPDYGIKRAHDEWREQKTLRRKGFDPLEERARVRAERESEAVQRRASRKRDAFTVAVLIDEYVEHKSTRDRSWRGTQHHLNKEIRPKLKDVAVAAVTRDQCRAILNAIERKGQPYRRNRTLQWGRAMWNWAMREKNVEVNPWMQIEMLTETPRDRYLRDAELRRLVRWLPTAAMNEDARDAVWLALLTGCRLGEIAGLRSSFIDSEEQTATVTETKNGTTHLVFLTRQAWEIVEPRLVNDWIIPTRIKGKLGPKPTDSISESLRKSVDTLKDVAAFTAHDLRRSMATWLGEHEDCPPGVIERMLNHRSNTVTAKHYNWAKLNRPAAEWWQRWADHLSELAVVGKVVELRA